MNELIGLIFITMGVLFCLTGTFSLVRFREPLGRLSASIKGVAFGTSLSLFGAFLFSPVSAEGLKALFCAAFLIFTSPVVSHAIARGILARETGSRARAQRKGRK